jgi:hypothetical protein
VDPFVGLRREQLLDLGAELFAAEPGIKSSACHDRILLDMGSVASEYY